MATIQRYICSVYIYEILFCIRESFAPSTTAADFEQKQHMILGGCMDLDT